MAKYKIITPNDIIDIPENRERSDFTIPNLKGKGYTSNRIYSGPEEPGNDNHSRLITNNSGFDFTYFTFDNPQSHSEKHTLKNGESVRLYTKSEIISGTPNYRHSYDYIEQQSNLENVYCAKIE